MARVEMIAVGRELLIGRTLNTNAHWVGARLASMGTMLAAVATVDDDLGEISSMFTQALGRRPDFLVVVGGLGPTPDDMTLKGVARGTGRPVRTNGAAMDMIKAHYARRGLAGIELTPARRKMAMLPATAVPVVNPLGTAPGARLESGGAVVFCLPGVPEEMKRMFRDSVEPEVRARLGVLHRGRASLDVSGVFESDMAPLIAEELRRHPGAYVKSHPKGLREGRSRILVDIAKVGPDRERVKAEAGAIADEIKEWAEARGAKVARTPESGRRKSG